MGPMGNNKLHADSFHKYTQEGSSLLTLGVAIFELQGCSVTATEKGITDQCIQPLRAAP